MYIYMYATVSDYRTCTCTLFTMMSYRKDRQTDTDRQAIYSTSGLK